MLECENDEWLGAGAGHRNEEVSVAGVGCKCSEGERKWRKDDWGYCMCVLRCAGRKSEGRCGDFVDCYVVAGMEVCRWVTCVDPFRGRGKRRRDRECMVQVYSPTEDCSDVETALKELKEGIVGRNVCGTIRRKGEAKRTR